MPGRRARSDINRTSNHHLRLQDLEFSSGQCTRVRVFFGPHYFLDLRVEGNRTCFILGATHHGFKADASEVNGDLEGIIEAARRSRPDLTID